MIIGVMDVISGAIVVARLEFLAQLVVNDCIFFRLRGLGVLGKVATSVKLQSCRSVARGLFLLSYCGSDDSLVMVDGLDHALCHCSVQGEGSLRLEIGKVGVKRDLRVIIGLTLLPPHVFQGLFGVLPQHPDGKTARL